MKIREYRGPLTVLASGVVGFSMFCIVAAAALSDPGAPNAGMQPQDFVDSAVSNINTVAALTLESVSEFIPTVTLSPSSIPTRTDLPTNVTNTATLLPTRTRIPPTSTRGNSDSQPRPTSTHVPLPTGTPVPTNTSEPTLTDTPEPPPTDTPELPTDTPEPPPTDTSEPPTPPDTPDPTQVDPANSSTETAP